MAIPRGFGGRDYPDFGVSPTANRITNITDLSELSVRLGSLSWFDRLGTVIMLEGFEHGFETWIKDYTPSGAIPVLSSEYFAKIPYAVKLITTTDVGSYSSISKRYGFPYFTNFGIEFHFKATMVFQYLQCWLIFYDGVDAHNVLLLLHNTDNQIKLQYKSLTYEIVGNLDIDLTGGSPFHVVKVTVDLANDKHVRLMLDTRDFDVTDVPLWTYSDTRLPYLYMNFLLAPVSGVVNTVWIDNVIFTINEPEV